MGSASETRAELFELDYFGRKAYLAQSPQFYKQMAMAAGFDKVFEIGPVFRADPSFTPRHSTEFISIDVEVAWIESHLEVMWLEERWLQYVLQAVKDEHGQKIKEAFGVELTVPTAPFPRITMAEAVEILKQRGHTLPPEKKGDLDPGGERLLGEYVKNELGHEFVFLVDWPISARAFYHMRHETAPTITKSFDLLWNGTEITTGAQREHRYDLLVQQAVDKGLAVEPLRFYFEFFKYGCPPHGGFGFGLARMLAIMLNRGSIREVTLLFRGPTRLEP
jgi:aspartyl/asparaginyl-tRNA synthetase